MKAVSAMDETTIDYQYLFRSLVAALPVPILILDQHSRIQHHNQLALTLLGQETLAPATPLHEVMLDTQMQRLINEGLQDKEPRTTVYTKDSDGQVWKIKTTPFYQQVERPEPAAPSLAPTSPQFSYVLVTIEDIAQTRRIE